ncbi:MAG: tetratricopeptide repeat protein [Proteobacteria bacterium]|nr:tetratricopeptide repeat protein [Pseudomonadota bacterium]MDA1354655.1 tetratricopeptide repeat protein [Pseudomonadota bacterium]
MSDPRPNDNQSQERRALGGPTLDDVRDVLEAGVSAYRKGDFAAAKNHAEAALHDMPNQPDALHLMALVAHQSGEHDAAARHIERALAVTPDNVSMRNNLAMMYQAAGRSEDAHATLGRILKEQPEYHGAHYNLANLLKSEGDLTAACNHFRLAILHAPAFSDAYVNLIQTLLEIGSVQEGVDVAYEAIASAPACAAVFASLAAALLMQNDCAKAAEAARKAIAIDPLSGEPYATLGNALLGLSQHVAAADALQLAAARLPERADIHNSLGVAFLESGHLQIAETALRRAVDISPTLVEGHSNLGHLLNRDNRAEEAAAHAWQAVELNAEFAAGWINLAGALLALDQPAEALTAAERATALTAGSSAEAENCLGSALDALARHTEAGAAYGRATALAPELVEAHFNRALNLLGAGDYGAGFAEYEWRLKLGGGAVSHFSAPMWDGTPLNGATILLHAEQGFGDTLQFIRFAPLVAQKGGRVVLACQEPLRRLLCQVDGVAEAVAMDGQMPEFARHAALASLPHILGATPDSLPPATPYVPASQAPWTLDAPAEARLKIGLAWSGSPANKINRRRSCALEFLQPLLARRDIAWYGLQVGPAAADIYGHPTIEDLSSRLTDFADTAAAIGGLDLVISIDSAVAHLAGALGHPVWVMLSHGGDWRYLRERADNPWYPTMQHFRQAVPGDWPSVINAVLIALDEFDPKA